LNRRTKTFDERGDEIIKLRRRVGVLVGENIDYRNAAMLASRGGDIKLGEKLQERVEFYRDALIQIRDRIENPLVPMEKLHDIKKILDSVGMKPLASPAQIEAREDAIDLRRDEPPSQDDLDEAALKVGCPECGSKSRKHGHGPRYWACCKCGHTWKQEVANE